MTTTVTLNQVLALAEHLHLDEQALLLDELRNRRAEAWRKQVARQARKAERDLRAGKLKGGSAQEVIRQLRADFNAAHEQAQT